MVCPTSPQGLQDDKSAEIAMYLSSQNNLSVTQSSAFPKAAEVIKTVGSLMAAIAFGGTATAWKSSDHTIIACITVGACVFPIMSYIGNELEVMKVKYFSSPIPKKREMTRERALDLLNIPMDKASDFEFIDAQYEKFITHITPKQDLGSSPLKADIMELLEEIEQAHITAKSN